jgi:hypothetical protein
MGWEFVAIWADEPDSQWQWIWRRIADDSGALIGKSPGFDQLEDCIADARRNGFDEDCDLG